RESDGKRPLERRSKEGGSDGGNLPPLLAAHLERSKNKQPLQSTLTSRYGGNQPLTNLGGNLSPNSSNPSFGGVTAYHPYGGYAQYAPMSNYGSRHNGPISEIPHSLWDWYRIFNPQTQQNRRGTEEGKENILEVMENVLSCVDAKERIIVNDKHPEQIVVIGKQILTSFKKKLQDLIRSNADVYARTYANMTAPKQNEAAWKEVDEFTKAGILREVKYQTWVANLVMVKKSDGGWRMCVDFTDINKAYPKDCYPLPKIDWKTSRIPFDQLRSINMKLNPKKCSFGIEEGSFLGNLITKQRIKANPSKVKEITDLKPPKMLKEIQSLTGKLAALSKFLSKGADKSLPFSKPLKVV
nr:retrotransposon protein, putative, Ty3-gypsy subclass [Tanacetum cinerariifolium]